MLRGTRHNRRRAVVIHGTANAIVTRIEESVMRRLIDTFELEPIESMEGEPLRFRVEVFVNQDDGQLSSKVLRWESMRLRPSFISHDTSGAPSSADYSILVEDDSIDVSGIAGATSREILREVVTQIEKVIGM